MSFVVEGKINILFYSILLRSSWSAEWKHEHLKGLANSIIVPQLKLVKYCFISTNWILSSGTVKIETPAICMFLVNYEQKLKCWNMQGAWHSSACEGTGNTFPAPGRTSPRWRSLSPFKKETTAQVTFSKRRGHNRDLHPSRTGSPAQVTLSERRCQKRDPHPSRKRGPAQVTFSEMRGHSSDQHIRLKPFLSNFYIPECFYFPKESHKWAICHSAYCNVGTNYTPSFSQPHVGSWVHNCQWVLDVASLL